MAKGEGRIDEIQGEIVHVYDGIEEADNHLPNWWLATLWGTVIFGIGYWFFFHVFSWGDLPMEAYAKVAAASAGSEASEELLLTLKEDPAKVKAGQAAFKKNCIVCHDEQGQGKAGLGANLTDKYWLHGGAPMDIYATVDKGAQGTGMAPFGGILGKQGLAEVVAYVLTLRNTDVPGREAQGEAWPPEGGAEAEKVDEEVPTAVKEVPAATDSANAEGGPATEDEIAPAATE